MKNLANKKPATQPQETKCELAVSNHDGHLHAANCGHKSYVHAGHICYEHEGHFHHMHGDHAHKCAGPFVQPHITRLPSEQKPNGRPAQIIKLDPSRSNKNQNKKK